MLDFINTMVSISVLIFLKLFQISILIIVFLALCSNIRTKKLDGIKHSIIGIILFIILSKIIECYY